MITSFARESPISRASRCVPPEPGIMPSPISGSPSCASSVQTRKSQASASSRPTPRQKPRIAHTTGFGQRSGAATFQCRRDRCSGCFSMKPGMSPPAVNALSPAPVRTMTCTFVSAPSSANSAASCSRAAIDTRFIFSGTSSVIVATLRASSRSTRKPSYSVTSPPSRAAPGAGSCRTGSSAARRRSGTRVGA